MGKRYQYYKEYCRSEDNSVSSDGEECSAYKQVSTYVAIDHAAIHNDIGYVLFQPLVINHFGTNRQRFK